MITSSEHSLRAWAEIDLDALAHNIATLRTRYAEGDADLMAVVKADAYGHGIDIVVPSAYESGVRHFGVATTDEGAVVRHLLPPDALVYVLSPVVPADAPRIVDERLVAVVSDVELAAAICDSAIAHGVVADVHLDVDTGMGRSGASLDDAADMLDAITALPGLRLTGIATHFASADEDPSDAVAQHRLFTDFLASLGDRARGLTVHASNSPASLVLDRAGYHTLLRPGLLMYGIEPAPGMLVDYATGVQPVLSLKAAVTLCRDLPAGATVSYGKTYTVPHGGGRYATIGIGYGDGFPRRLGGRGHVLLHGRPAPIRGRVCMDQFVVDVGGIPGVAAGDIATLVGRDGGEEITAGQIALDIGTTPHEISTCLTPRTARIPIKKDKR